MNDCIFCKISNKEQHAEFVHEDSDLFVIKDILPKAPVHLLIIPRAHIGSVTDMEEQHIPLFGKMVLAAKKVAEQQGLAHEGYRLVFNVGRNGGQVVQHVHIHLLGGKQLEG